MMILKQLQILALLLPMVVTAEFVSPASLS